MSRPAATACSTSAAGQAVLPLLREACERIHRRRRRRESGRRAAGLGRGASRGGRIFDLVLCTQVLEHCDDPAQAVRELRRVVAPGGRVLASTHGVQVYHPSPQDYWRWTHAGLRRLFAENAEWQSVDVMPAAGTATSLAMLLATYTEIGLRRSAARAGPRLASEPHRRCSGPSGGSLREPCPGSLIANFHVVADVRVRSSAATRSACTRCTAPRSSPASSSRRSRCTRSGTRSSGSGRSSARSRCISPSSTSGSARPSSASPRRPAVAATRGDEPGGLGCACALRGHRRHHARRGAALAWFVPLLIETPEELVWDARVATFLVDALARGALSARALLQPARRSPALRRPESRQLRRDGPLRRPRGDPDSARRRAGSPRRADVRGDARPARPAPLLAKREFPELRLRRSFVTRERVRNLASVSWSNFLVHIASKVVFSTDVVVVGIVLGPLAAAHLRDRVEALRSSRSVSLASARPPLYRPSPSTRAPATRFGSGGCCSPASAARLRGARARAAAADHPGPADQGWLGEGYADRRRCWRCWRSSCSSTSRSSC